MLSYRHAFHAGNHADVLKHLVLVHLMDYLNQKDKPFWVIDTHAGAGGYRLDEGYATKLNEFVEGVTRLWGRNDLPSGVAAYLEQVRRFNPTPALRFYPGSPSLVRQLLRPQDKHHLFELHPTDFQLLQQNFAEADRRFKIQQVNGFNGLKALLPPAPRRALVLIDPSYETRDDYLNVVSALQDSVKRFATGCYAVWYPRLSKPDSRQLPDKLKKVATSWLHVALDVTAPAALGMFGSGMFVINPPWTLKAALAEAMPYLREVLAQDQHASFILEAEEK
jgi:23S rRNA (adenine2030-N6)-methyltransferase